MNKRALFSSVVIGLLLIGGGVFAYTNNQNNKNEEKMAMQKKSDDAAMANKDQSESMDKDSMTKTDDAMMKDDTMMDHDGMAKHGSYVTLANYTKDPNSYADSKKVYFFHASWCLICQGIDKEASADMTKVPADVTLIKTDFDTATELRKKYGVTTQYTFVQVDASGNETAQWSATSLADALAGIKA